MKALVLEEYNKLVFKEMPTPQIEENEYVLEDEDPDVDRHDYPQRRTEDPRRRSSAATGCPTEPGGLVRAHIISVG